MIKRGQKKTMKPKYLPQGLVRVVERSYFLLWHHKGLIFFIAVKHSKKLSTDVKKVFSSPQGILWSGLRGDRHYKATLAKWILHYIRPWGRQKNRAESCKSFPHSCTRIPFWGFVYSVQSAAENHPTLFFNKERPDPEGLHRASAGGTSLQRNPQRTG